MNDNVKINEVEEELTFSNINGGTLSCGASVSAASSNDIYAGDSLSASGIKGIVGTAPKGISSGIIAYGSRPSNLGIGGAEPFASTFVNITENDPGLNKWRKTLHTGKIGNTSGLGISEDSTYIGSDEKFTILPSTSEAKISENNTWDGIYIGDPLPNSSDEKFTILPSTGNITFTYPAPEKPRYSVFLLSRREMPKKVFLCGRLASLGNIGDDVQVAYDGRDYLVIAPKELTAMYTNNKITVAVEYDEVMEHYEVEHTMYYSISEIQYEDNSNVLKTRLVSSVPQ